MLWVHQKLLLKDEVGIRTKQLEAVSGETISYLGHNYRLKLVEKQAQPLVFDGHWFNLRIRNRAEVALHFNIGMSRLGQNGFPSESQCGRGKLVLAQNLLKSVRLDFDGPHVGEIAFFDLIGSFFNCRFA